MSAPVVSLIRGDAPSEDESRTVDELLRRLMFFSGVNDRNESYYEAKQLMKHMAIAIPPEVAARIRPVIGWAGTVVDIIEERLDWYGWTDTHDSLGLAEVYADNMLDVESGPGHLDACLYGTAFIRVGSGDSDSGEPSPLVTVHSPRSTTGTYSMRLRRLVDALTIVNTERDERLWWQYDSGQQFNWSALVGAPSEVVLDMPGVTTTLVRKAGGWSVTDRDEHGLDRIPVVQLANRPRASRPGGRSELSRAVRYYCDAAVRTVLGMEANREFYGIPQLTLLGRGREAFVDEHGQPTSGWRVLAGHVLAIDKDDAGDVPTISQLEVSSPQPFLEQVKGWALLLATEAAIPPVYLGYHTTNPASADAIRAMESRLVKRTERRQTSFGRAWLEVAQLALKIRDGQVPNDFHTRVGNRWRDAATPTRAAAADETTKYVGIGVLPPDSTVTYDRMGLTPTEQRQLQIDKQQHEEQLEEPEPELESPEQQQISALRLPPS